MSFCRLNQNKVLFLEISGIAIKKEKHNKNSKNAIAKHDYPQIE